MGMNILPFILFGLINGLIINALEPDEKKGSYLGAVVIGMLGALTGGTVAMFLFGRVQLLTFSPTFIVIIVIEAILLFLLLFGKGLKKV